MKKKTINAIITKKFNDWLKHIDDKRVMELVKENSIVTGGCIASMLLKEDVKDFDVYFTNKETVLAVANYYVDKWNSVHKSGGYVLDGDKIEDIEEHNRKGGGVAMNMSTDRVKIIFNSAGVAKEDGAVDDESETPTETEGITNPKTENEEKPKYRPVYLSCNAVTLSDKIQIVIRFYGNPETIHDNYDFIHCTNYWTSKDGVLVLKQGALESLLAKELQYIGSKYPLASIVRVRKFINRGWTINAGQLLKMSYQVSLLDLTDINVLEDQLVGVDVAYFNQLISALQTDKERPIDYTYLSELIDKIF